MGGWDWGGGGWKTGFNVRRALLSATSRLSGHCGRRRRQAVLMSRRLVLFVLGLAVNDLGVGHVLLWWLMRRRGPGSVDHKRLGR